MMHIRLSTTSYFNFSDLYPFLAVIYFPMTKFSKYLSAVATKFFRFIAFSLKESKVSLFSFRPFNHIGVNPIAISFIRSLAPLKKEIFSIWR
jgi:hypothetical protein